MKSKLAAVALAATAFLCATAAVHATVYEVNSWPGDVDNIPCSAWRKAADGTWVLTGTIKLGGSEITNVGVKGDAAARALEKKCGK